MNEQQMQAKMAAVVAVVAALNLCAQLDQNPHGRIFEYEFEYEKVSSLFTENGKMHIATKEALARVVNRRLGGEL